MSHPIRNLADTREEQPSSFDNAANSNDTTAGKTSNMNDYSVPTEVCHLVVVVGLMHR